MVETIYGNLKVGKRLVRVPVLHFKNRDEAIQFGKNIGKATGEVVFIGALAGTVGAYGVVGGGQVAGAIDAAIGAGLGVKALKWGKRK